MQVWTNIFTKTYNIIDDLQPGLCIKYSVYLRQTQAGAIDMI